MVNGRTLFDTKVREHSGAQTSARYQFQANVAILKLCDLHEADEQPYHVLVDQFDDLVLIRPGPQGRLHEFFQVKGKTTGNWTIGSITKGKKDAPPPASILGKLYENASKFGKETGSINFLSNAGFSAKLSDGKGIPDGTMRISSKQLHDDEKKKIDDCLEADFPSPRDPDYVETLFLERTPMGLNDQQTFVIGRLSNLLENIGIVGNVPTRALYQALFSDISVKAASAGTYVSDEDLLAAKAVGRDQVSRTLEAAAAQPRFAELWPAVEAELISEGTKPLSVLRLRASCLRYIAKRAAGQFEATRLSEDLRSSLSGSRLAESISSLVENLTEGLAPERGHDSEMARAGAIVEILERIHAEAG